MTTMMMMILLLLLLLLRKIIHRFLKEIKWDEMWCRSHRSHCRMMHGERYWDEGIGRREGTTLFEQPAYLERKEGGDTSVAEESLH